MRIVAASLLLLFTLCHAATAEPFEKGAAVVAKRSVPLASGEKVLATIPVAAVMKIGRVDGDWLLVEYKGRDGWVKAAAVVAESDAISHFTKMLESDPESSRSYRGRAVLWARKGRLEKALQDGEEAVRLDPKDARAYLVRGGVWAE